MQGAHLLKEEYTFQYSGNMTEISLILHMHICVHTHLV